MNAGVNGATFGSSIASNPRVAGAPRDSYIPIKTDVDVGVAAQSKSNSSYFDLDFYRYFGAVIVALDHISLLHLPIALPLKNHIHESLQPLMGFFFTLSGFVIMHMYDGRVKTLGQYGKYIIKRLARLYPLHILTVLLWLAYDLYAQNSQESPITVISNILLLHAWGTTKFLSLNYPSWSVSAEFFVYILFPILLLAVNRAGAAALALPVLAASGDWFFFHSFHLGDWTAATCTFGCLRAAPSFIAGMVVYRLVSGPLAGVLVPTWAGHVVAIATVPLALAGAPAPFLVAYCAVVVITLALAEPSTPGVLSRPWARALANGSYGFYMLHAIIALAVFHMAHRFLHISDPWKFALTPLVIASTTVASILSFRFFEDPARRYIGKLRFQAR